MRAAIVRRTAAGETPADRFVEQAVRQALSELAKKPPVAPGLGATPPAAEIRAALTAKFTELLK